MLNIKNKLLSIAICFLMLVSVFGFGVSFNQTAPVAVNAETISVETNEDFWLVPGARIRYGDGYTGISYRFQIKESVYEANRNEYAVVKYGILIAPKDGYDLSFEKVFGDDAIYGWAEKDENGNLKEYTGGKTQIVNLEATALKADVAMVNGVKTNVRYFNGNLVRIKPENFLREFQAKAYVAYSTDGINFTYTDNFVGDDSNVRSIAYVAQMALRDESPDAPTLEQAQKLRETYMVDRVVNSAFTYTVEHYIPQKDGSYALHRSETSTSEYLLDTEVFATPIEISDHVYDDTNTKNVSSGKILANGKLVLKLYYKANMIMISLNTGDVPIDDEGFDSAAKEFFETEHAALYGTSINLSVQCDGYILVGWKDSKGNIITNLDYTVTTMETLTAMWVKDPFAARWGQWTPIK